MTKTVQFPKSSEATRTEGGYNLVFYSEYAHHDVTGFIPDASLSKKPDYEDLELAIATQQLRECLDSMTSSELFFWEAMEKLAVDDEHWLSKYRDIIGLVQELGRR